MVQLHSAALLLLRFGKLRSEILNSKLQAFFRSESVHSKKAQGEQVGRAQPRRLSATVRSVAPCRCSTLH